MVSFCTGSSDMLNWKLGLSNPKAPAVWSVTAKSRNFWAHAFLSARLYERTPYWAHAFLSARFSKNLPKGIEGFFCNFSLVFPGGTGDMTGIPPLSADSLPLKGILPRLGAPFRLMVALRTESVPDWCLKFNVEFWPPPLMIQLESKEFADDFLETVSEMYLDLADLIISTSSLGSLSTHWTAWNLALELRWPFLDSRNTTNLVKPLGSSGTLFLTKATGFSMSRRS